MNEFRDRPSMSRLLSWPFLLLAIGLFVFIAIRDDADDSTADSSQGPSGEGVIQQWDADDRVSVEDFEGELLDGSRFEFDQVAGTVAVFNVWGSWCGPCRVEAPALRQAAREYRAQGVTFVGLNVRDNDAAAIAFERKFQIPYSSIRSDDSGDAALAFGGQLTTNAVPATVVVDREGRLAARILGVVSAATLRALLDDVLAEPAAGVERTD
ncbi:TlpA disulfide reductase family protein [Nocardioides caricicola]|uniref:TlpA family protein disulfide reductase n=1 Tax=Nocardioides caricicola TaxID=634770 RepID=A0ABW0N6S4_9ACTN